MDKKLMSVADKAIQNIDKLGSAELVFFYTALSSVVGINTERNTTMEQLRREIEKNFVPLNKTKFQQFIKDLYSNGILDIEQNGFKMRFLLHDIDTVQNDIKREWSFED